MSEVKMAQGSTSAHPYSSPNPPPPGLPSTQQSVPTQLPPQQALAVQTQPPPPTGPQYYTQLAYPAVSGLGMKGREDWPLTLSLPFPLTQPQPQVVLAQPQQPIVATQQTLARTTEPSTSLPKYAFVTSVVITVIFTVLCWVPGLLCLVPATVMSILVSCVHTDTDTDARARARTHTFMHFPPFPLPQALSKKEENNLKQAKEFSIISFVLVLIFAISYPILVTVVVLASVFGYICDYQYGGRSSYYYYYYRPSYCAR